MRNALSWQPIHQAIESAAKGNDRLSWIVVPFIKIDALERLLDSLGEIRDLVVIARWRIADFSAGVSDLAVFPFLQARGVKLYANPLLHMKLYIFNSNIAVNTSGNLTLKGLGYSDSSNIEVANCINLQAGDWIKLHAIERDSRLITTEVYNRYKDCLATLPPLQLPPLVGVDQLFGPRKEFTLGALPATENPETLIDFFLDQSQNVKREPEFLRRAYHDLATYGIEELASTRDELVTTLRSNFCSNTFVRAFLGYLQESESLHFGAVTSWIHSNCDDVPLPYRWEVKSVTRCLYNWLAFFVDGVSWDRPNHSQVIRWNAESGEMNGRSRDV